MDPVIRYCTRLLARRMPIPSTSSSGTRIDTLYRAVAAWLHIATRSLHIVSLVSCLRWFSPVLFCVPDLVAIDRDLTVDCLPEQFSRVYCVLQGIPARIGIPASEKERQPMDYPVANGRLVSKPRRNFYLKCIFWELSVCPCRNSPRNGSERSHSANWSENLASIEWRYRFPSRIMSVINYNKLPVRRSGKSELWDSR